MAETILKDVLKYYYKVINLSSQSKVLEEKSNYSFEGYHNL